MRIKLTENIIKEQASMNTERREIHDTVVQGLSIRFNRRSQSFFVRYRSGKKQVNMKIGDIPAMSLKAARARAQEILLRKSISFGKTHVFDHDPLGVFLEQVYSPWAEKQLQTGKALCALLQETFFSLWECPIGDLSIEMMEDLKARELEEKGNKPSSWNKKASALKASLNWGRKRKFLTWNPLKDFSLEKLPQNAGRIRYLLPEEEASLLQVLKERSQMLSEGRSPSVCFGDFLEPAVILSLNTGIRRGALFGLEWNDILWESQTLHVRAEICKTGKERYIPLNEKAFSVLSAWREECFASPNPYTPQGKALIFPSPKTGQRMQNCDSSWRNVREKAGIKNFRWHDLRHTFASKLAMAGVDINVLRELLGHGNIGMTTKYIHLFPGVKSRAVALI